MLSQWEARAALCWCRSRPARAVVCGITLHCAASFAPASMTRFSAVRAAVAASLELRRSGRAFLCRAVEAAPSRPRLPGCAAGRASLAAPSWPRPFGPSLGRAFLAAPSPCPRPRGADLLWSASWAGLWPCLSAAPLGPRRWALPAGPRLSWPRLWGRAFRAVPVLGRAFACVRVLLCVLLVGVQCK